MTEPEPLQQLDRTYVRFHNRKLLYFSGCDYHRLASHPRVMAALEHGLEKYGLNVSASRLTTGNHVLYRKLEERLMDFFEVEDALLVPTGFMTNLVVAQAMTGSFSHALIDEKSHPSLADAARLLDCPILIFKHRDPEHLAQTVQRCGPSAKVMLLTDGMFSHDGAAAPLSRYLKVLPKDARMLVDDAHGAGVLGHTGKGSLEHEGVSRRRVIQTITLSKAFGVYGGAVLANKNLRERIIQRSKLFVGCTPLPLPLASAALESVRILKTNASLLKQLGDNTKYVQSALFSGALGNSGKSSRGGRSPLKSDVHTSPSSLMTHPGPIIPIIPHTSAKAVKLKRSLLDAGIFPPFIQYPSGPAVGYFRFAISSLHSRTQLNRLIDSLKVGKAGD
jgi:7-keto-8-aminopelargonate synthetase-like enzyme